MEQDFPRDQIKLSKLLFAAICFMGLGLGLELFLLWHFEDPWQLMPIICIGAILTSFIWYRFRSQATSLLLYKLSLGLSVLVGLVGVFLHFKANYEFEVEINPRAETSQLILKSFTGAMPVLSPGSMIIYSIIGYAYLLTLKNKNEEPK